MKKLALLLTILLLPPVSNAVSYDGKALLSRCNELVKALDNPKDINIDVDKLNQCGYYLTGYVAAINLYQRELGDKGIICFPKKGISPAQIGRVIVQYLNDNPKLLQLDEDTLTSKAAMKAFPCKKQGVDLPWDEEENW